MAYDVCMLRLSRITALCASATLALVGLSYSTAQASTTEQPTINVFAASSMTEALTKLGADFQKANPGSTVRFSFLASSALATQIAAGAPADLFISASMSDIAKVKSQISTITPFLTNRVVIGVPKNSPIRKSRDLNGSTVKWIQCTHTAPCGVAADSALAAEKVVTSKPVSLEANAAGVVAKVLAGEADAGIMYHTDIMAHFSQLRAIGFRDKKAALTTYGLGVIDASAHANAAAAFKEFLLSKSALTYLNHKGFGLVMKAEK